MTDTLVLGTAPGSLSVILVLGDPWEASLILKEDGVPVAWPSAPVLEFAVGDGFDVTATLGPDDETSTADAQATWSMTEEEVAQFAGAARKRVRLSVDGETYWKGSVQCLS